MNDTTRCECGHSRSEHEPATSYNPNTRVSLTIYPCTHRDYDASTPEDLNNLARYGYTRHCVCYDYKEKRTA
jgi:hypothetical protein